MTRLTLTMPNDIAERVFDMRLISSGDVGQPSDDNSAFVDLTPAASDHDQRDNWNATTCSA